MNIQNGLRASGNVLNVLGGLPPLLGALVEESESLHTTGAERLAWVQSVVRKVLEYSGNSPADVEAVMPTVAIMINAIVAGAKQGPTGLQTLPPAQAVA